MRKESEVCVSVLAKYDQELKVVVERHVIRFLKYIH